MYAPNHLQGDGEIRGEEAAEAADAGDGPRDFGALHKGLHQPHALVPGGDVHPGGGVCGGMGVFHAPIVSGVAEGCVQSGCALIGGETAEHPGVMDPNDYDVAGFAVGMVDKPKIIDGSRPVMWLAP